MSRTRSIERAVTYRCYPIFNIMKTETRDGREFFIKRADICIRAAIAAETVKSNEAGRCLQSTTDDFNAHFLVTIIRLQLFK